LSTKEKPMKTRLVAFASTIVAVFYTAGATWRW
jgi:hypothetical protein